MIGDSLGYIFRGRPETINKFFAVLEDLAVDTVCTFHATG